MSKEIKVAELFAGVGGFRLGLDGYSNPKFPDFKMKPAGNFHTVWANNWEPDGGLFGREARELGVRHRRQEGRALVEHQCHS